MSRTRAQDDRQEAHTHAIQIKTQHIRCRAEQSRAEHHAVNRNLSEGRRQLLYSKKEKRSMCQGSVCT